MQLKLPRRVVVSKVIASRYGKVLRPNSWDERRAGEDLVETSTGEVVRLQSTGQQSVPDANWVLMLLDGNNSCGFSWTLYGMPKAA